MREHGVSVGMLFGIQEVDALAKVLGVPELSKQPSFLYNLISIAEEYWRLKTNLPDHSRLRIKATLSGLADTSRELREQLEGLDDWSRIWLLTELQPGVAERDERIRRIVATAPAELDQSDWCIADEILNSVKVSIDEILMAAERASQNVGDNAFEKKQRGRRRNLALYKSIQNLWIIFHDNTDDKLQLTYDPIDETYKGPFLDLVRTYLGIIDSELQITDTALGDTIRRALGKRQ